MRRLMPALVFVFFSVHTAPGFAQDAHAGEKIFKSQCGICHSIQTGRNMVGPSLASVVGRKAGSVANYHYSSATAASGLTWDAATLDRYLADPRGVIPGNKMSISGVKNAQQRQDLIAYLSTLR